ncbi:MAG TPA: enoyl-CoA hydratase/isomerase family protein [Sedimenticola thiotaurini]|uniref:Enoyl-CoA hydratase/isomerase family protein n=1 Tax=Sedimenticola thiotaurini TaxID=1543721 RepID=A0A831RJS4_9GAMM|nr:enoyl-CoA hydratase/isomerase family protein [Sedimenticola thiotaurini]
MNYENILLEQIEPAIWLLTVNRPRSFNALDALTLKEIHRAALEVGEKEDARVLLVTGAGGKAFVAGADIAAMQGMSGIEGRQFSRIGMEAFRALELLPIPVIALVDGYCLGGGCELAMACDWILASDRAVFGQPEVNLGVTPGFGGSQRLPRLIGRARAMELLVTGRRLTADEALAWGLVNHVHPADRLRQEGLAMARGILEKGPLAVKLVKEAVQRGQDLDLDNACALESEVFGLCFSSEDQKEGMSAFLEKRSPDYKGR